MSFFFNIYFKVLMKYFTILQNIILLLKIYYKLIYIYILDKKLSLKGITNIIMSINILFPTKCIVMKIAIKIMVRS